VPAHIAINSSFIDMLWAYVDGIDTSRNPVDIFKKYRPINRKILNNYFSEDMNLSHGKGK